MPIPRTHVHLGSDSVIDYQAESLSSAPLSSSTVW